MNALHGKLCLVTGGTSGIGQAAATQLAAQGAAVLLTGRDQARGAAAVAAIRARGGRAEFLPVDFGSLASVRALAGEVRRAHGPLHVLVNNAGIVGPGKRRLTADGFELTFAVNHLAPFLLTGLLGDRLASGARVVTVSSDAHRAARRGLDFDDLQGARRYRPFSAYSRSKLANVLFTYELARRRQADGVVATCLHPGVVRTRIWQEAGGVLGWFGRLGQAFMISAEQGGRYVTRLAADPALEAASARYYHCEREVASSPASHDTKAAARLWRVSEELVRPFGLER